MQAAALLHDVVEDTDRTLQDVEDAFGLAVAALVDELTEPAWEGNRAARKALECARLGAISAEAQTIKCADLISNTRSIVSRDPGFAKVYLVEKAAILSVMDKADPSLKAIASASIPTPEV